MRTLHCLIQITNFAAALQESMKSCVARDYFRDVGVWIRMRTCHQGRARRSIEYAKPILICKTTPSYRSTLMNGFAKLWLALLLLLPAVAVAGDNQQMES